MRHLRRNLIGIIEAAIGLVLLGSILFLIGWIFGWAWEHGPVVFTVALLVPSAGLVWAGWRYETWKRSDDIRAQCGPGCPCSWPESDEVRGI